MLAVNNSFMEEAAETVYQLSAEEKIRMQCEAREDIYRQQRYMVKKAEKVYELEACNAALQKSNAEKDEEIARPMRIIAEQKTV